MQQLTSEEVESLTNAVQDFGDVVRKLKARRVYLIFTLCVLAFASFAMSVAVAEVSTKANHNALIAKNAAAVAERASSDAAKLQQEDKIRCEAANEFKVADRARWDFLIQLAPPDPTPEGKARRVRFLNYINQADELKKC